MKDRLIIITGPTGVGKTSIALEVAKKLSGEIISCDSYQIYKGMDIGTGKIRKDEMQGIAHHNLDLIFPDEEFNVALFKRRTEKLINDITRRNKVPILEGGTGLYLHSILYGLDFATSKSNNLVRSHLTRRAEDIGLDKLYEELLKIDPKTPKYINPRNKHRIIRALEIYKLDGLTPSESLSNFRKKSSKYGFLYLVINDDRQKLYERINNRVDMMIEDGLLEEIRGLLEDGYNFDLRSFKAIGYKEFKAYFNDEQKLKQVVDKIKQHSRNYAKRQITWFKREKAAVWVDRSKFNNEFEFLSRIISLCEEFIENE